MHKFITPRVGSDVTLIILTLITTKFQSTLPVWGATFQRCIFRPAGRYFNPRSPCGERLDEWGLGNEYSVISIHAPRVGSNRFLREALLPGWNFNPRSPCGERPIGGRAWSAYTDFNPRSPCGERPGRPLALWGASYFNPRSPCGERLALIMVFSSITVDFNPRSPCGERPVGAS